MNEADRKIITDFLVHNNCFDTAVALPFNIKGEDERNVAARNFCSVVKTFFPAFNDMRIKQVVNRDSRAYLSDLQTGPLVLKNPLQDLEVMPRL